MKVQIILSLLGISILSLITQAVPVTEEDELDNGNVSLDVTVPSGVVSPHCSSSSSADTAKEAHSNLVKATSNSASTNDPDEMNAVSTNACWKGRTKREPSTEEINRYWAAYQLDRMQDLNRGDGADSGQFEKQRRILQWEFAQPGGGSGGYPAHADALGLSHADVLERISKLNGPRFTDDLVNSLKQKGVRTKGLVQTSSPERGTGRIKRPKPKLTLSSGSK